MSGNLGEMGMREREGERERECERESDREKAGERRFTVPQRKRDEECMHVRARTGLNRLKIIVCVHYRLKL